MYTNPCSYGKIARLKTLFVHWMYLHHSAKGPHQLQTIDEEDVHTVTAHP